VDGHLAFGAEGFLGVVGKEHASSPAVSGNDFGGEGVLLHGGFILSRAHGKSNGFASRVGVQAEIGFALWR
jgi:hypothetical protein